ncbi:hypothetical protein CKM354_001236000 [Cercospora kikuchii]|uniref:Beta-glucuronidase C-terminal domain-containing protein n=1 Tax=Cercospora kikuchii TaxID=84275 RepID=A0A9P3FLU6_9PEZI|nr:uncharacterized protein CKM354_001236000 [Cercospora kikuchii]GIZ49328.1 hypothetical protein CKM354_001236000 [Cercospora kikuchii]
MRIPTYTSISLATAAYASPLSPSKKINIPASPPKDAKRPLEHFVSYSIEFSSLADFAGNLSNPNNYSYNLLENVAKYAGSKPLIRVGGNTQDLTIFNASQEAAVVQVFNPANPDYPANQTIGSAWFESYQTWPGYHFSHGFNLGEDSPEARQALLDSVPYACKALEGRLYAWELGNEPDLFIAPITSDPPRDPDYNEEDYVAEWLEWSRRIREEVQSACPALSTDEQYKFLAPSFAGAPALSNLSVAKTFSAGLNEDNTVGIIAQHKYIGARGDPGITLQGTLMNHTNNKRAVGQLAAVSASIHDIPDQSLVPKNAPIILGEGNSLARQGIGGVSNSFGAALWGFDYALTLITGGLERWHMHQGTNYRYQPWQPIETRNTTRGTKAPYYGNIATAAFLGDLTKARPQIVDLNLPGDFQSAFASYVDGDLAKIAVVNLQSYNTSNDNEYKTPGKRPGTTYSFKVPRKYRSASLQRLTANGSDAITGVTFDGFSYAYELDEGRPVRLNNVTCGEEAKVKRGQVIVEVPDSSAVILNIE